MSDSRGADQGDHTEAVGDGDAIKATGWGIQSIKQIVPLLVPAATRPGEDYDDLTMLYERLINQWSTELNHVASIVGGAEARERYAGQDGPRYLPLPKARQRDAVRFLNQQAFATPSFFLVDEILRKIEVEGALRRINQAQNAVLTGLLNDRRLERLIEYEALATRPGDSYSLSELWSDVRTGIWSELGAVRVTIDPYRRELQRSFLTLAQAKLNPSAANLPAGLPPQFARLFSPARPTSDIKAIVRSELRALEAAIRAAGPKAGDRITRAHLDDAAAQIDRILDPPR